MYINLWSLIPTQQYLFHLIFSNTTKNRRINLLRSTFYVRKTLQIQEIWRLVIVNQKPLKKEEVASLPLDQQPWVQLLVFPKNFLLMLLIFIDVTA